MLLPIPGPRAVAVILFIGEVLEAHADPAHAVDAADLGRCFAAGAAQHDGLEVDPSPRRRHPEGSLRRRAGRDLGLAIDPERTLTIPASFVADYKAIAGDHLALRLRFAPGCGPDLAGPGGHQEIEEVVLDSASITLRAAAGAVVSIAC